MEIICKASFNKNSSGRYYIIKQSYLGTWNNYEFDEIGELKQNLGFGTKDKKISWDK